MDSIDYIMAISYTISRLPFYFSALRDLFKLLILKATLALNHTCFMWMKKILLKANWIGILFTFLIQKLLKINSPFKTICTFINVILVVTG